MRVYKLDENLKCRCEHPWAEHQLRVVVNPRYKTFPLTIHGMMAGPCEYVGTDTGYLSNPMSIESCVCEAFTPKGRNVNKLVKEWVKENG